jgi:hypothetical protein
VGKWRGNSGLFIAAGRRQIGQAIKIIEGGVIRGERLGLCVISASERKKKMLTRRAHSQRDQEKIERYHFGLLLGRGLLFFAGPNRVPGVHSYFLSFFFLLFFFYIYFLISFITFAF